LLEADADSHVGADALLLASSLRLSRDDYREALGLAIRAGRLAQDDEHGQLQALRLLRRFEEPARMQDLAARIDWRRWTSPATLAEASLLLSSVNLFDAARGALSALIASHPRDPSAHYLDGLLSMFEGRREASLDALGRALRIEPRMANAHWLVAMQAPDDSAAEHVQAMQRAWPAIRPGTDADAFLGYAMHRRLHALGCHDAAWAALERGTAAMRRLSGYDARAQAEIFDELMRLDPGQLRPFARADDARPSLIFIVGMFRSGTSLIERVVTRHPDVLDGGETYQFSAAMRGATDHFSPLVADLSIIRHARACDFGEVRQRFLDYATWRAGDRRVLTEKLPSNFLNLGFILHAFPEAKVLHLRRDLLDTCFSNLRTILMGAPYACDQAALADFAGRYLDLMAHWHTVAPGRILDVGYEAFVADPTREARRVLEFCGLDFTPAMLDLAAGGGHTTTASAADVRGGIVKGRGGAWRPYERHLRPLIDGLKHAGEV
jgi:tetratricopeptide (TPR) repeat protein